MCRGIICFVQFHFGVTTRRFSLLCLPQILQRNSTEKRKEKDYFFALKRSFMFTSELLTVSGSPCSAEGAVVSRGWGRWVVGVGVGLQQ